MIESSLPHVSHKTATSEPLFSLGTGVQEFNRSAVSCSGVIESSQLLVCHTERLPQSLYSLWEHDLNRYPSTVFKRQPGLQPAIDPEFY